jgi:hypothetical protein
MRQRARWIGVLLALGLAGCTDVSETTEQCAIIQSDGSGILELITTLSSTNTQALAERLAKLSAGEEHSGKLTALGFVDIQTTVLEDLGTQAVLQTSARFDDWRALGKWFFLGFDNFDPEQNISVHREGRELAFEAFVPGLSETNCDASAELPVLTVAVGNATVLETNADLHDEAAGEIGWSVCAVCASGIYFRIQLPDAPRN